MNVATKCVIVAVLFLRSIVSCALVFKYNLKALKTSSPSATSLDTKLFSTFTAPVISVEGVTCSHDGGSTFQLNDVSYLLPSGGKVGLVGRNGCGKSTFLKILAQSCVDKQILSSGLKGDIQSNQYQEFVFTGSVESGKGCRVAYVEQEPPMSSGITVADALLGITSDNVGTQGTRMDVYHLVRAYHAALTNAESDPDQLVNIMSDMDTLGGWEVLTKADEIATKLRVKHLESLPLSNLSGGERKRVALSSALVQSPDVLLLDEPTNHLDLSAIRWISDLINDQPKLTLLTVTHDRAFLEDVCDTILELDRGRLHSYDGNYARFIEQKAERLALEDAAVKAARSKYKRELEWMRRQPQARATKQKARIDAFYKLEKATIPRVADNHIDIANSGDQRRLGNNVMKLKNVSLKFGSKKILNEFSYDFNKGDKIGIVGGNGVGKSTFLKVLTSQQTIDHGSIETGGTVVFGIYDQLGIKMDQNQRVMDFVKERVEARDGSSLAEAPQEAMKLLKQFQFERQRWQDRISLLSGGERRRLQLLSVLAKRPNFLVLDEPSNDIDLDTLGALEDYLTEYKGVLLVVSHDRFFTDKVTDHLFVFEGNGVVKDFTGTLSEYAECLVEIEGSAGEFSATNTSRCPEDDKRTTYKKDKKVRMQEQNELKSSKKEMKTIEKKMEKLRSELKIHQTKIDESSDEGWTYLAEVTGKLNDIKEAINENEMRWLDVAEVIESIENKLEE